MSMLQLLNVPEILPRWATDVSRAIEPSEDEKDIGWEYIEKPPAKWMNWLQKNIYQWARVFGGGFIANWFGGNPVSANGLRAAIFHPILGLWFVSDSADIFRSGGGALWSSVDTPASAPNAYASGIDITNVIFGLANGDLRYSANGSAWSTDNATGLAVGITAIETKYPSSVFTIIGDNSGNIKIAAGGVGTAWVSPTTPPIVPAVNKKVRRIIWASGSTWLALIRETVGPPHTDKVYVSIDDGDNWALTADYPANVLSNVNFMTHMDLNRGIGTQKLPMLICVGDSTTSTPKIAYSEDLGDTWTEATVNGFPVDLTSAAPQAVYHCGGSIWLAVGGKGSATSAGSFGWVSTDGGLTWDRLSYQGQSIDPVESCTHIACDGKKLIAIGDNGFCSHSLAVP